MASCVAAARGQFWILHVTAVAAGMRQILTRSRLKRWYGIVAHAVMDVCERTRRALMSKEARARRRILIIDDMVPDPLFGAGYPRAFKILRTLVDEGYTIDHFPLVATPVQLVRIDAMFDRKVRFHPARGAQGLRRLLSRHGSDYMALFVSRPAPMRLFGELEWQAADGSATPLVIYDAEAVIAPREKRRRELYGPAWSDQEYLDALAEELELARGADTIMTVGPGDAAIIRSALDAPVFVLPHSETARIDAPGFEKRRDFLFVGRLTGLAAQTPNVDSVLWFATEVMPLLDSVIGTRYCIRIVGLMESSEIAALASDRILLHGVAEDLRPIYDACRVFIAPTRFAAGIPAKVTEAMSEGIPCVVTTLLAEQLDARETELAAASNGADFAEQCARLYTDPVAWASIRDGGFAYVERACSPSVFREALANALHQVGAKRSKLSDVPSPKHMDAH